MKQVDAQTALTECFGIKRRDDPQDIILLFLVVERSVLVTGIFFVAQLLEFLLHALCASGVWVSWILR